MTDKLIQIDGKFYKEHEVLLLPAKDFSGARIGKIGHLALFDNPQNSRGGYVFQHLYIVSNEEIKEDDFYINTELTLEDCDYGKVYEGLTNVLRMGYTGIGYKNPKYFETFMRKIIATTDKSLNIKSNLKAYYKNGVGIGAINLPRPSDNFIAAYVKAQGKGFEKVLVEYNFSEKYFGKIQIHSQYNAEFVNIPEKIELKVAPDNTITCKSVEKAKKQTFTRDELKTAIWKFHRIKTPDPGSSEFDIWFDENY